MEAKKICIFGYVSIFNIEHIEFIKKILNGFKSQMQSEINTAKIHNKNYSISDNLICTQEKENLKIAEEILTLLQ